MLSHINHYKDNSRDVGQSLAKMADICFSQANITLRGISQYLRLSANSKLQLLLSLSQHLQCFVFETHLPKGQLR